MTGDDRLTMKLLDRKPGGNGSLLGRATVEFGGLVIADIGIFSKDTSRWSQMPSEPMRDRDGQVLKDDQGKVRYRSPLKWANRSLQDRFSHALISAIEQKHGAIGGAQ